MHLAWLCKSSWSLIVSRYRADKSASRSPADACPAGGVRVRGNGNGNGATSSSENTHGDGGLQRAASPERDTRTSRATRSSRHFARRRLRTRRDQVVSQRPAFGKRIKVPIFRDANLSHFIVKRPTSKRGVLRQVIVQMTRSKMPAAVRYAMGMKKARMNLEARLRAKVDIDGGGENEVSELSARLSSLTCK